MVVYGLVLGAILGSFIKVLADRSLTEQSFGGRSYCPECKHQLHWYDLFPVISYLLLKGRCRYCHKKISIEYPLVEILTGILIGYLFLINNFSATGGPAFGWQFLIFISELVFKTFFICVLVMLTITDIKQMLIPDRIIIPAILISLAYLLVITVAKISYLYYVLSHDPFGKFLLLPSNLYFHNHLMQIFQPALYSVLIGLVIGGFFYALIIITRGKGMGGGDVKLGAFLGFVLGFQSAIVAFMFSFISGSVVSILLIFLGKKNMKQLIPFGPFLAFGGVVALFWGNQIVDWYLHLSI